MILKNFTKGMAMKVLVATEKPFASVAVDGIREVLVGAGAEVVFLEGYSSKADLIEAVGDVDALIVRSDKVDAEVMDAGGSLKVVVRAGAGYDNVDLEAATRCGVCVQNTPGQNSNAVAELVFGMAIMMARGMFNGTSGWELLGKGLGIQAFGQVGRCVARIARGFEMRVSALDPFCPDDVMLDAGVTPVHSVEELYRNNKVVSIHIPATAETRGSIGYDLVASMPKGGLLINTARREVVDEEGLIMALKDRPDLKYAADVAPCRAEEMKELFGDRVFFTPKKMGAQTAEANVNAGIAAARQVVEFLRDGVDRFRVNK